MMAISRHGFVNRLTRRLDSARRIAVVGVGDELLPRDRPGMFAARYIRARKLPGVSVFLTGTVPESFSGPLRKFHPDHVIFIDSADMGVSPGTIDVIVPEKASAGLVSTHALPLPVVMKFVARDTGTKVTLLGIQPDLSSPDGELSGPERELLEKNLAMLVEVLEGCIAGVSPP